MASNIPTLFNQSIPAAFAANPAGATQIGTKFHWTISGPNGGEWFVDTSASGPSVQTGNPGNADCNMSIADTDFAIYLANPQNNGLQLYFAGKILIYGNQMAFQKFPFVLALRPS